MNLLIRVDASTQIGTGHVMRCLALAQAWQDTQGQPIFILANYVPALEKRLQSEGMKVVQLTTEPGSLEDAQKTAALAHQFEANWVVLDGYHFGGKYQQILKQSKLNLLFIDDYGHAEHYYADFILNQNISANEQWYQHREPYSQLLLGTRYALLRREFWPWQKWQRTVPPVAKKVLVTLGGSDPDNVTLKVIQALQLLAVEELEVVVVVGGSNPHYESLEMAVQNSRFPIRLERNVTNMPELMVWADIAISAGGSTCWELAFMGLPSILLILAENQRAIAEKLGDMKIAINLGWYDKFYRNIISITLGNLLADERRRIEMSQAGKYLVDGTGCDRVIPMIQTQMLRLRPVQESDAQLLWEWANDPQVRAASFSSEPIPWEQHVQWFDAQLKNPNCLIYIAMTLDNLPIGQIRYKIENYQAVISISIARDYRHQCYGSELIKLACDRLFKELKISQIHAYIKPDNQSSIRSFIKAGFAEIGTTNWPKSTANNQIAMHLVKNIRATT